MQERFVGRLKPGLDVCDVNGDKVGTVVQAYRYDPALVAAGNRAGPEHEEILEVKTGFMGLGKHLFIPLSAIQEVGTGCVFLGHPRPEIERSGWAEKPSYFDELT